MKKAPENQSAFPWRPKTPAVTVDIIIVLPTGEIVLIERKNDPQGFALPGGFVDIGETLEQAAIREAKEETGLDVTLMRQVHAYSHPSRDKRLHTVSIVFIASANGKPRGASDAKKAIAATPESFPKPLCFDHETILKDFLSGRY
jgi:8-oxo-dGTP diphosphatase